MYYRGIKITEDVNSYTLHQSNWTAVLNSQKELRISSALWTLLKIDFWKWFNEIERMIVCINTPGGMIGGEDINDLNFFIGRQ